MAATWPSGPGPAAPATDRRQPDGRESSMVDLFGQSWTRAELLERVGDVSQIAGARLVTLADGPEDGVAAAEIRTGQASRLRCCPVEAWTSVSPNTEACHCAGGRRRAKSPRRSTSRRARGGCAGFSGGLMATCGLSTAGWPSTDQGVALPLHGRASYLPARRARRRGLAGRRVRDVGAGPHAREPSSTVKTCG